VQAAAWLKSHLPTNEKETTSQPRLLDHLFNARQGARTKRENIGEISARIPGSEQKFPVSEKKLEQAKTKDDQPVDADLADKQAAGDDRLSRLREAKKRARR
jgi:hypothetical protein